MIRPRVLLSGAGMTLSRMELKADNSIWRLGMDWSYLLKILTIIQHFVSFLGVLIILSGVILAIYQYLSQYIRGKIVSENDVLNSIRLNLGRTLILGLEFIVAADLIGTTTAPDYYTVGILAIIVIIRTVLSFTLNKELMSLSKIG